MPPRGRKKASPAAAPQPFEAAKAAHAELVQGDRPLATEVVLTSYEELKRVGTAAIGAKTLDVFKYAEVAHSVAAQVLSLNTEGAMQPPLDESTVTGLASEAATFQSIAASKPADTPPAPTDTTKIRTDDRKGA